MGNESPWATLPFAFLMVSSVVSGCAHEDFLLRRTNGGVKNGKGKAGTFELAEKEGGVAENGTGFEVACTDRLGKGCTASM